MYQQAVHELERVCTIAYRTPDPDKLDRSENASSSLDDPWSFSVVWKPAGVASQELEQIDTKLQSCLSKSAYNTQAVYWLEKAAVVVIPVCAQIVDISMSNTFGHLTTLDAWLNISDDCKDEKMETPSYVTEQASQQLKKVGALVKERENRFRTRKLALEAKELTMLDGASVDLDLDTDDIPFAYTIGEKEFCSLRFRVTKDTLIPRPSTQTLVDATLDWIQRSNSPATSAAPFTHIVCNPPYLTGKRYQRLSSLTAEPALALIGPDTDGLGAYRALAKVLRSNRLLLPGGLLVLEVGRGLAERVENEIFSPPNGKYGDDDDGDIMYGVLVDVIPKCFMAHWLDLFKLAELILMMNEHRLQSFVDLTV
ncbi:hypothetical protein BDF22DRAFT_732823 [Syncephalis plumigaleata]|nr:hypothetical protein BDF22DRAFT_732823 [Syncephalis plumigaleata]